MRMDEYIGPMDSEKIKEVPMFESPATGGQDEKELQGKDPTDAGGSQRHCSFCSGRISVDDPTTYSQITSWVRGPKKDSPVLREYTGLVACGNCIAKLRAGVSPTSSDFEEALDAPAEPVHADYDGSIFTDQSEFYLRGHSVGYSGMDLDPECYTGLTYGQMDEYRNGWLDGAAKVELDRIRSELGEQA